LLISIVVFGLTIGGKFFSSYTLTLILQQIAVVGILGAAQTLVILTAGIDLSVGVIMVMSAVVMGNCALYYGLPAPIAVKMLSVPRVTMNGGRLSLVTRSPLM
jgi:fructose transport system permease protein